MTDAGGRLPPENSGTPQRPFFIFQYPEPGSRDSSPLSDDALWPPDIPGCHTTHVPLHGSGIPE